MTQPTTLIGQLHTDNVLRACLLLVIGYFISRLLSSSIIRGLKKKLRPHQAMLLRRVILLVVFLLFFASAMQELNFRISALLGATGILTVALGIASQTSMSNLISGLFLIGEKPFEIGDSISLDSISGEIINIDSMSVRIRTVDNTMVRIPNEVLIKSSFTNLSYFPTRRVNLTIGIAYRENVDRAMAILLDLAKKNPLTLPDPAPEIILENFADSAVNLQLQVWTNTSNRKDLMNVLLQEIKETFEKEKIEIPFPSRSLYAGDPENGLPVRIISSEQIS